MKKLIILTCIIQMLHAQAYITQQPFNSYNLNNNRLNTYEKGIPVEPIRMNKDLNQNSYGNRYNMETNSVDFYRVNARTGVLLKDEI